MNGTEKDYALWDDYRQMTPGSQRTSAAFLKAYQVPDPMEQAANNVTGVVITGAPKATPGPGGEATKVG